jgi:hypothetical protein
MLKLGAGMLQRLLAADAGAEGRACSDGEMINDRLAQEKNAIRMCPVSVLAARRDTLA